jgi:hypothetical protein
MIAACDVTPESTVDMSGDRPHLKLVKFDSNKHTRKDRTARKDRTRNEERGLLEDKVDTDSANASVDYGSPSDDPEGVFSEKDKCLADKLGDDPEDAVIRNKLVMSSFNEFLKLDVKMHNGQITAGSKEALRYQALSNYLGKLAADPKYASVVKTMMYQRALVADQNLHTAAGQAGSSSDAARQLRAPGGALSDGAIQNFKTLLTIGKIASDAQVTPQALINLSLMISKALQTKWIKTQRSKRRTLLGTATSTPTKMVAEPLPMLMTKQEKKSCGSLEKLESEI